MREDTLKRLRALQAELKKMGKDVGVFRDKLEELIEDAKEDLLAIDGAMEALDMVVDRLSEQH